MRCLSASIGCLVAWVNGAAEELSVSIDFAGGSAKVWSIDQKLRIVRLSPTPHKDLGWECWWYFKLSGITPGETITLDVGDTPFATPDRAAYSTNGNTWQQTDVARRFGPRAVYREAIDAPEAWFAWGPPYVSQHAEKLCERAAKACPHARSFQLCKSRGGRPVPALHVAEPGAPEADRYGVWVQARQHAWEAGSSWVCHGFVEWLVSDDRRAQSLRQKANISVVPIFAMDTVEIGAGGKAEAPHDHNRDWSDEPRFHSTAAAIKEIKAQNKLGRFDLFIDIHNASAMAREPFFFVPPRELLGEHGQRNLDRFVAASREEMTGAHKFRGLALETGPVYDPDRWMNIAKNWVALNTRGQVVSLTLETPWNVPHGTAEGYQELGAQLGLAMERYFRTAPREK